MIAACALAAEKAAADAPLSDSQPCTVAAADRVWIEHAIAAWRLTSREITKIQIPRTFHAVLFDASCQLTSSDALTGSAKSGATWTAAAHGAVVRLPNGQDVPAGVVSFAGANKGSAFFVMSTPSVWRANGVDNPALGLETMMTAVLLHEATHVVQSATYGKSVDRLVERYGLPETFSDDSMQKDFRDNQAFSESITRETDLFFQAAAANDDETAVRLARQARAMMKARAARWFVGDKAYYLEAEDLWLTFEGSGQWAGFQWLINPRGAARPVDDAISSFARRGGWWSQTQGAAIALTLDRLGARNWTRRAFGDGSQTFLQILDAQLKQK